MKHIFSQALRLPDEDCGSSVNIVRLHNEFIDSRKKDKKSSFFRKEPVVIINKANGSKIMRYAIGNGSVVKGLTKESIALDYDGVDTLGVRFKSEVELVVRRATCIEVMSWFFYHSDLGIRLSIRLGFLGAILGIVSLVVGILPFFH